MPQVIVPSDSAFVALSASKSRGKLFRKMVLRRGESFVHPANPNMTITVDDALMDKMVENFENGMCDTVQFPLVDENNRHVEDPMRNLGQVVGLTKEDDGLYTTIDVRKDADAVGSTILGASAMFSLNYTDTKTGKKVGPTLLHVAATNRPYLTKLAPYEAVALSDADSDTECVVLSRVDDSDDDRDELGESDNESDSLSVEPSSPTRKEETVMDFDEMIAALRDDYGIDVPALQEQVKEDRVSELTTALSNVLRAADSDLVALSNTSEDLSIETVANAVVELSNKYTEASEKLETLELSAAEVEIDGLVKAGKVLPAQRDAMLELRLSNPEMFERLVPETALVSLSEQGVTTHEQPGKDHFTEAAAEVDRLLGLTTKS